MRLSGWALRYGDRAPAYRESVRPGALTLARTVRLVLGHDGEALIGDVPVTAALALRPEGIAVRAAVLADVAAAREAVALIRHGIIRGWSVEFVRPRWRRGADGWAELVAGVLVGVALVRVPAYPRSVARLEAD